MINYIFTFLGELEAWCQQHSNISDDDDAIYVVHKCTTESVDGKPQPLLCVFITTRRLTMMCKLSAHIMADATYKLIYQGYPVLMVGTTDRAKAYHPFGIALSSNEKNTSFEFVFNAIKQSALQLCSYTYIPRILVADAAEAITIGFKTAFGDEALLKRVMCWFHMKKAYEGKDAQSKSPFKELPDELKDQLNTDIYLLHMSESPEMFERAYDLFVAKWRAIANAVVDKFLDYFNQQWFEKNSGWYEGFAPGIPSTNNALESTNGVIKKDGTVRKRFSLANFLEIACRDIVSKWSIKRNPKKPIRCAFLFFIVLVTVDFCIIN